jgi:hypothetical protein
MFTVKNAKEADGFMCPEYILVYVDVVLIELHLPHAQLERMESFYKLKPTSIGPPMQYLGADVQEVTRPGDPSGEEYWSFSATSYSKNAVRDVKVLLQAEGQNLKTTATTPFPSSSNQPKADKKSDEFNNEMSSHYSQLIDIYDGRLSLDESISIRRRLR